MDTSEVLAAKALDVVVTEGLGLGGPELVEDPWPWFVICPLEMFVCVSQRGDPE